MAGAERPPDKPDVLRAPSVRDPDDQRLLFRVRLVVIVVVAALVAVQIVGPVVVSGYRPSEVVFASTIGALLLLLGVEGIKLIGGK